MKKSYILLVLSILILPGIVEAQRYKQRWKSYRSELHFGIGPSNFLGELGGADQVGTNYFKDLEFGQTRLAVAAGLRYKLSQMLALNTKLSYGKVSGSDDLTKEFFRNYRNLDFKTNIWEASTNLEIAFIREQVGHRYRLKGVRGQRGFEISAYGFIGVGVFYFNPKGSLGSEYVNLQSLGTEGQGISSTRKKYSKVQLAIPLGIGFKYAIDRRWGVGLEYGIRKTFTDYIDDASKTYYDNNEILSFNGAVAAAMADKSDQEFPYITAAGQQRGDPRDKDAYMFAIISINYKIRTGRSAFPMF
ncbi:MAG: outer membrane beta-barrel protein [Bacteroidia bacterium]|nr:outer membrane beta-barrel protein [Bacteroidia bacterium]